MPSILQVKYFTSDYSISYHLIIIICFDTFAKANFLECLHKIRYKLLLDINSNAHEYNHNIREYLNIDIDLLAMYKTLKHDHI